MKSVPVDSVFIFTLSIFHSAAPRAPPSSHTLLLQLGLETGLKKTQIC